MSSPIVNKPQLENLWSLGIKDPLSTESDDEALDKFCKNIQLRMDGMAMERRENLFTRQFYSGL